MTSVRTLIILARFDRRVLRKLDTYEFETTNLLSGAKQYIRAFSSFT